MFTRRSLVASLGALLFDGGFVSSAFATSLPDVLRLAIAGTTTPALGALAIRSGKVDQIAAVGLRRLGRPERVQIGEGWLIGSCGKPITAALIARLADRGVLRHGLTLLRDIGTFWSWLIQFLDRAEDQVLSERQSHI